MNNGIIAGGVLTAVVCLAHARAQPAPALRPEFEVASVRLHEGIITAVGGLDISGSRVTVPASTVADLVANAYGIKDYQLAGAAEWMRSDRYDIVAAAGGGTPTPDQARQMLQSLLANRFQLKIHRETRELPVYALVVGNTGPRLKENAAGSGIVKFNRKGRDVELTFTGTPVDSLAAQLPRMPGVDRPVLNETGLSGKYDFQLTLTDFQLSMNAEKSGIPAADSEGASVFTALQDQLGLKLESRKAAVEILIIDHADKPSEN